jgi:hypothetical protein
MVLPSARASGTTVSGVGGGTVDSPCRERASIEARMLQGMSRVAAAGAGPRLLGTWHKIVAGVDFPNWTRGVVALGVQ